MKALNEKIADGLNGWVFQNGRNALHTHLGCGEKTAAKLLAGEDVHLTAEQWARALWAAGYTIKRRSSNLD